MRRCFVFLLLIYSTQACQRHPSERYAPLPLDATEVFYQEHLKPFYHGVASGDPTQEEVVIWTRLTPDYVKDHEVAWEISGDSSFTAILHSGTVTTSAERDFTVKKRVSGLQPDTYYWYRFLFNSTASIIGRTKTLPENPERITLISVSCNAYESGYFNAFKIIGDDTTKIDAVLHLGDYIYEDFQARFITKPDRTPLPRKELVSLQDYRTRYAQYRLDPDLQRAHQQHPFITIWDDHEIANDAYTDGAGGHQDASEGDYALRSANAVQAYYEWLPIRDQPLHYRQFNFGELASLFMLDERLAGKSRPVTAQDEQFLHPDRTLLGEAQFNWLLDGLVEAEGKWKIIGNQVLFADFDFSPVANTSDRVIDNWSGYPVERRRFIDQLERKEVRDVIMLSGDSHCSWGFEVKEAGQTAFVELGIPSLSSGNWGENQPDDVVAQWETDLLGIPENNHMKYVNLKDKGFGITELTPDNVVHSWVYVDKESRGYDITDTVQVVIRKGSPAIFVEAPE